ncbi:MAG: hypothetical protein J6C33_08935 [Lachnospiraceae bacterium]|nr:hypothetical protein [Lachnospiraceae bacterium]
MRKWLKVKRNRILLYILFSVIGLMVTVFYPYPPELSLRLVYERGLTSSAENQIWVDYGNGWDVENEIEGLLNLGSTYKNRWFDDYFLMDFDLKNVDRIQGMTIFLWRHKGLENFKIPIQCMEVYNRGICIRKYSPDEIYNLFEIQNVRAVDLGVELEITADPEESPIMTAKPDFIKEFNAFSAMDGCLRQNLIFSWILFGLILICVDKLAEKIWTAIRQKKKFFIHPEDIVVIAVLAGVIIMAGWSQPFAHGDEDALMRGVEFYKSHWLPPNMYGKDALGTFSYGGYSRLWEKDLFYILAGKIAWMAQFFFRIIKNFRVFNVIMWLILTFFYLIKKNEQKWLFLALFTTPQIWYLHTYTLSDTWDLFVSIIIIYELAEKKSLFNCYLEREGKTFLQIEGLLMGIGMFFMIFLAKKNFYLVLLFAFVELLRRWFAAEREKKTSLLLRYVLILCGCFLLLFCQEAIYRHCNVGFVSSGTGDLAESYAMEGYKPSERSGTLEARGQSYFDVLQVHGKGILESLMVTSTGSYAWSTINADLWYQIMIFLLYLFIIGSVLYCNIKEYKIKGLFDDLCLLFFLAFSYLMVVYTCWSSDFQPQGRYLLMIWPIAAYYSRNLKELYESRAYRISLLLCAVLSLYSFYFVGIRNLVWT